LAMSGEGRMDVPSVCIERQLDPKRFQASSRLIRSWASTRR
jgi:hypothetical protein